MLITNRKRQDKIPSVMNEKAGSMVLGIYGAHGLAQEVNLIAKKINAIQKRWSEIVYIDDINDIAEIHGRKVYKFEELLQCCREDGLEIVIAVGEPSVRELLYQKVLEKEVKPVSLIHPGVYIDETTSIGKGVVICEGATITSNVAIGDNTYIQPHAVIGHDIQIGRHTVIGSNCQIGGADIIGDRVFMGFLSGTTDHICVGNDVIISAGAIVFRDLPDGVVAVGNPARVMKKNGERKVFK